MGNQKLQKHKLAVITPKVKKELLDSLKWLIHFIDNDVYDKCHYQFNAVMNPTVHKHPLQTNVFVNLQIQSNSYEKKIKELKTGFRTIKEKTK